MAIHGYNTAEDIERLLKELKARQVTRLPHHRTFTASTRRVRASCLTRLRRREDVALLDHREFGHQFRVVYAHVSAHRLLVDRVGGVQREVNAGVERETARCSRASRTGRL